MPPVRRGWILNSSSALASRSLKNLRARRKLQKQLLAALGPLLSKPLAPASPAAILRLMEDCVVSLDDPVAKHIPEFSDDSISIFDLLVHTSGLPNKDVGWPDASWEQVLSQPP